MESIKKMKLWKNIEWDNEETKKAFFNKYFKNSSRVLSLIKLQKKEAIDFYKDDLKKFIENDKEINIEKIIKYLGG